jgi:hypothetical protein
MSKRRKSAQTHTLSKQALVREAARRKQNSEYDLMNERKPGKRVKAAAQVPEGGYLSDAARGVLRRLARVAMAPLALARAVVDRFRSHEAHG